jgi:hypothetical protein
MSETLLVFCWAFACLDWRKEQNKNKLLNHIYWNGLLFDIGVVRALEDAVDALARLDEQVAGMPPGTATLMMLRSAQAIVAANDRPLHAAPAIDAPFAALLGWWYSPEAREFIADDVHLRTTAVALDAAAGTVLGGRALTLGLLDDAMRAADAGDYELPSLFDAPLRRAESEGWPALLLAAALSSGTCAQVRSVTASIARAVAPLTGRVCACAFVVPTRAVHVPGALHALASEARAVRRRVDAYRGACALAADQCGTFGRGGDSALALVRLLAGTPAVTIARASTALEVTVPTAGAAVERLMGAGLLRELTGRGRDRVFAYVPAIALVG